MQHTDDGMNRPITIDDPETRQGTIILDGKRLSLAVQERIKDRIQALPSDARRPCLAVVQVGDDPSSSVYVSSKRRVAEAIGMVSRYEHLAADSSTGSVVAVVERLSSDSAVDGVLVQLPLPRGVNTDAVIAAVRPDKDVDGLQPVSLGHLVAHRPMALPCTPKGIMRLLEAYRVPVQGKRAVVLGRSQLVGLPAALLLLEANATVTVAHSRTAHPESLIAEADIVVVAIGSPRFVRADWVKPGATIVDVGINRVEDANAAKGYRLFGDTEWDQTLGKAYAVTPVPGGVGLMTVAMLMENTWEAYLRHEAE